MRVLLKKIVTALLCAVFLLGLAACSGGADSMEGLEVITKELLDSHGYREDGRSLLEVEVLGKTVKDCGDYYEVRAVLYCGVQVPGNLEMGDSVSVVINDLTGEELTLTRMHDGSLYDDDNAKYYYMPSEDGSPITLHMFSGDRMQKPTFDGILRVSKDATHEMFLQDTPEQISEERLKKGYWYNCVYFDENGYALRLCLAED